MSADDKKHVHVDGGRIEVNPSPELVKQYETNRSEERAKDQKDKTRDFWISFLTLIGVAVYTVITGVQACMVRDHFQRDQRPYLWVPYVKLRTTSVGEQLKVDLIYANYGKSPAIKTRSTSKVFQGSDALGQADNWFSTIGPGNKPFPDGGGGSENIVPPALPDIEHPANYTTAQSDLPLRDATLLNIDAGVVVAFRVEYYDTSGRRYWTDMCSMHVASTAIARCKKHNEIH